MAYYDSTDTSADSDARRLVCPQCGQTLTRIQRRPIDRLISLITPVQRFQCRNHACQWLGNIKGRNSYSDDARSSTRL
jgi:hypothetical protein